MAITYVTDRAIPERRLGLQDFTYPSTPLPPQQVVAPPMSTPLPPQTQVMNTGGNTPPQVQTMYTGGNTPPQVQTMNTGGNLPPVPLSIDGSKYVANLLPGQAPGPQFSPSNTVNTSLDNILNPGNSYITNARRRAVEYGNKRGVLNSTIAAGAGERAAIEASMPILNQVMGLHGQREQQAFQNQQNSLDRIQQVNRDMLGAELKNWMDTNAFSREFNGTLSMLPIKNSLDLSRAVSEYAMQNPELYSPQVVSGMSEFFNRNALSILQSYFPSMLNGGG